MNLETPRCVRCEGTRFLHARRMVDVRRTSAGDSYDMAWEARPVAALTTGEQGAAIGRFETLICRRCGATAWYAFDHGLVHTREEPLACAECATSTGHLTLPAIEHGLNGAFVQPPITRGMLGTEGALWTSICTRCARVRWWGTGYALLDRKHFVSYRLSNPDARACLACGSHDALLDDRVREDDGVAVPVGIEEKKLLGFIPWTRTIGHFALRLCRPCGLVEWFAAQPDKLVPSVAAGLSPIGDRAPTRSEGPYR